MQQSGSVVGIPLIESREDRGTPISELESEVSNQVVIYYFRNKVSPF